MTESSETTESRIENALGRLETLSHDVSMRQRQGVLGAELESDSGEIDVLRAQNDELKAEIEALKSECQALESMKNVVSGRLDDTIDELSAILEQ